MILVVAGILAVIVIPQFNLAGYENTRATAELIQGIRYTQFQSLYHSDTPDYQITITSNAVSSSFTVANSGGAAIADPANPGAVYTRTFPGITINPTGTIVFDGRGEPSCIGFACTAANLTLTVSADSITMERFTGFVH